MEAASFPGNDERPAVRPGVVLWSSARATSVADDRTRVAYDRQPGVTPWIYDRGMTQVDPLNLVGVAEIAERLGVGARQTVHSWRVRYPNFPTPVATLEMGLIWSWPDVEKWARATGRLL